MEWNTTQEWKLTHHGYIQQHGKNLINNVQGKKPDPKEFQMVGFRLYQVQKSAKGNHSV